MAAIIAKGRRRGVGTPQFYASGLNFVLRRTANAVGNSRLKGKLLGIGDKVTPFISGAGVFAAGFNIGVIIFCIYVGDDY
jgi:hypothetical protein